MHQGCRSHGTLRSVLPPSATTACRALSESAKREQQQWRQGSLRPPVPMRQPALSPPVGGASGPARIDAGEQGGTRGQL